MKKILLILFVISFLPHFSYAQELQCAVSVNFESLPVASREKLSGFKDAIQSYMNQTRFSEGSWVGEKIACSMSIFFLSASGEVDYKAQVVVTSQRPVYQSTRNSPMLTINDPSWAFRYEPGQPLYANQSTFDPITSFLDYYGFIIVGFDWDSYERLGGTPYFSKAINLCNLASVSTYSEGWTKNSSAYNRRGLVEDLLNDKYRQFREALFNYHLGVDLYEQNKELAQDRIVDLIETLEELKTKIDMNSVLLRTFFDAKNGEIADLLFDYPDKTIFNTLKQVDPSHMAVYEKLLSPE
ncbi:MAG: DUF4835 family protein [Ignavibacteriaceae bacterium]